MTAPTTAKPGLHPRNRHAHGYDFTALAAAVPALSRFLTTTPDGHLSVDFANAQAVTALNRALLEADYGVRDWTLPPGSLCPPIPGRADLIHTLADLLASDQQGQIPRGEKIWALDIGTGASAIYPIIGHREYGWRFVGVDIDRESLSNVERIITANPGLKSALRLRHQPVHDHIFLGTLRRGEYFDLTLCNPPFHASPAEAETAAQRKWKQLGKGENSSQRTPLNFGGQRFELWYPGGERAFLGRMIEQSATIAKRCLWFTSLVANERNLKPLEAQLQRYHPTDIRILPLRQGQKQSRILAWTFQSKKDRLRWTKARWHSPSSPPRPQILAQESPLPTDTLEDVGQR